jgi:ParB family chromosome partitioning protein
MRKKETKGSDLQDIDISLIEISDLNTRRDLEAGTEDSSLDDLARSIAEKGLLSPIIVRKKNERYELIVGQRRYIACRKLGWKTIPAIVRSDLTNNDATAVSLIENVHRAEMNPIDKANALKQLLKHHGNDYKKVSKETGIGLATIKRYIAILQLPEQIKQKVSTTEGPAKVQMLEHLVKTFPDKGAMLTVYQKIAGFTQAVQMEILKQSDGSLSKVDELVEKAHEGVFKMYVCKGIQDCAFVSEWVKLIDDSLHKRYESIKDVRIKDLMRMIRKQVKLT